MGVSYSSCLFVGAELDREHFYTVGETRHGCNQHGQQSSRFCGDCGRECYEEFDKIWRPEMLKAADALSRSPERIWEDLGGDPGDGHYLSFNKVEYGPMGFYDFGYENDIHVFGMALTRMSGDDRFIVDKHSVVAAEMPKVIDRVLKAFKTYSIESTIRVLSIQNCG
jgi:hypothetical protein